MVLSIILSGEREREREHLIFRHTQLEDSRHKLQVEH